MSFDLNIENYNILELRKLLDLEMPLTEIKIMINSNNIKSKILKDDTLSDDKKEKILKFLLNVEEKLNTKKSETIIQEVESKPSFDDYTKGATVLYYNEKIEKHQIYVKSSSRWIIFNSE